MRQMAERNRPCPRSKSDKRLFRREHANLLTLVSAVPNYRLPRSDTIHPRPLPPVKLPILCFAVLFSVGVFSLEAQTESPAASATPAAVASAAPVVTASATPAASPAPTAVSAAAARSERAQKAVGKNFASGWGNKLREGGTTALIQLAVSIFGATFAFERFINLRRTRIVPRGLSRRARELWAAGDFEALEKLDVEGGGGSTLGRAIAWVVRHRHASFADVSAGAGDIVSQELEVNQQRAYPLGVVATLEPLLGLLGMILGMIGTFETVAMAGALGDPAQLAGGISEALVTTGLGLAIAIPFLALFHYFKSRTNMYGSALEKELTGLLSEWFLSAPGEHARTDGLTPRTDRVPVPATSIGNSPR